MHKSNSHPLATLLLAVLALFALGTVALQAENVFVTAYTGSTYTQDPPYAYGTGISAYGTSAVGSATPAPPARTRAMYGYQLGTNAWVTTQPTVATSGPGSWYKMYILRGTDGNASTNVIVNITVDGGGAELLDPSGNLVSVIPSTAFQSGSGAVNNWLFVGTLTNLTTTSPKVLWAYASGQQGSAPGRCYFDAFRFYFEDLCAVVTSVGVGSAIYSNQTVVTVSGVIGGATNVTVYADGSPIGNTNYAAGFAAGNVNVPTSALVPGAEIKATQTVYTNGLECTSVLPPSGPLVGGGANPTVRLSLGLWQNADWAGPVGTNTSGAVNTYFLKCTGLASGYGTAPLGGQVLPPGECWQTVTFSHQSDPAIVASSAAPYTSADQYCALESLAFALEVPDSGPYEIYVDRIMNGTNIIENFEGYTPGVEATFNNPNAASIPYATYYNQAAPNDSLISSAHKYDGTNSCRIRWQWTDGSNVRWARVLANGSSGKTYPMLKVSDPITVQVLVLPLGKTNDGIFNGTVGPINYSPAQPYQGGSVVMSANVTGGPFNYEWFYQGSSLGVTTPSYTNSYLPFADTDGPYTVVVSEPGGCAQSAAPVTLNLQVPLPIITNQPVSAVVNVGDPVNICVGATNAPVPGDAIAYYTWEKIVPGVSTNYLGIVYPPSTCLSDLISSAQLTDTADYQVIVQGNFGAVTSIVVSLQVVPAGVVIGNGDGLRGNYFNLPQFTGGAVPHSWAGTPTLNRVDPTVNFDWILGSPNPLIQTDYFAVRWYGQIQPLYSGSYEFTVRSDDGCRLWIDNTNVINSWIPQGATDRTGTITLDTTKHNILLEYFEQTGNASVKLYWTNSGNIAKGIVPVQQLFANQATWTPPSVQVTSPANGSTLLNPINLAATVTTNSGIVKYVEFYRGATWLVTVTNPPYATSFTLPAGIRNIAAKVVYNESSWESSVNTNTVTVIAVSPVTITGITPTAVQYTGGGGSQFVLVGTNNVAAPLANWARLDTNSATPGSFTITPSTAQQFYRIKSE